MPVQAGVILGRRGDLSCREGHPGCVLLQYPPMPERPTLSQVCRDAYWNSGPGGLSVCIPARYRLDKRVDLGEHG